MTNKTKITFRIILFLIVLTTSFLALSQNNISSAISPYTPMEEIPGMGKPTNFYDYVIAIYKFGIGGIGICAMLMIIIGGYMYMTSAGNNASMESAKGVITDAIVGLLLAFSSFLILYVINPDLVKIKKINMNPTLTTAEKASTGEVPIKTGQKSATCSEIPSQVPGQCSDASPQLNSLLGCITKELGKNNIQISSISDGNGGLSCYSKYSSQCTGNEKNCCFHKKTSCHYGGKSCTDGSHAVDLSTKGSSASGSAMKSAVISCGGKALDEGNHIHASIGGNACGCDVSL